MRVAVVVPAHNESRLVGRVVTTSPQLVDHMIVIDDASTNETGRRRQGPSDRESR